MPARRRATRRICRRAKPLVTNNEWQGVRDGFGQPDLVIRSSEYKMPAVGQDVWYRPMSDIPITEPRWVKMVEIRPTNLKARKILHHSIAYLVLNDDAGRGQHRHRHTARRPRRRARTC